MRKIAFQKNLSLKEQITVEDCIRAISFAESCQQDLRDKIILKLIMEYSLTAEQICRAEIFDIKIGSVIPKIFIKNENNQKVAERNLQIDIVRMIGRYIKNRDIKHSTAIFISTSNHNKEQNISTKTISRIIKLRFFNQNIKISHIKGRLSFR